MLKVVLGILIILHGLVHLLYFGHAQNVFKLQPGLKWPGNSWLLSNFFGIEITRLFASLFCLLSAIGFLTAGVELFLQRQWWDDSLVSASLISSMLYLTFWDGKIAKLNDQGVIGVLINLGFILLVEIYHWPNFGY